MLTAGDRTLQKGPKETEPYGEGASSPAKLVLDGEGCGGEGVWGHGGRGMRVVWGPRGL